MFYLNLPNRKLFELMKNMKIVLVYDTQRRKISDKLIKVQIRKLLEVHITQEESHSGGTSVEFYTNVTLLSTLMSQR